MNYKQAIVIRSDLRLTKGKLAVQCAHASYSSAKRTDKKILNKWEREGQKKIVLKVKNLRELKKLQEKCRKLRISSSLIADAGLTEIRTGTITCLAIGPDEEKKINKITGSLPLLR